MGPADDNSACHDKASNREMPRARGSDAPPFDTRPAPQVAQLFHRLHERHQLIKGDLGPLLKTRCPICLTVSFIPMQRREDVASSGSHGFHRDDGGDRNVVKDCRTIAGKQHGGPAEPLHRNDFQETADVGKHLTLWQCDVDAEDAARA